MKPWAEKFYSSNAWRSCREYVKSRDAYLCQDCLRKGLYQPAEEVHHITPLTPENIEDPDVSLNPDNLVSLCKDCHKARHGEKKLRYKVDEFGRVTIV